MGQAWRGESGDGQVITYTVPRGYFLRLEMLYFELQCDGTAGIHKARVTFLDSALNLRTAVLRDLNEGGASEFLTYTYGIGLNASACVTVDGWELTDALPNTVLAPETQVWIGSVDDSGSVIGGDNISGVTLFGDLFNAAGPIKDEPLLPGLLPGSVSGMV